MREVLVAIEDLSKHYVVKKSVFSSKTVIKAVNNISFDIRRGETLGLIGESGSGKTTTGSLLLQLESSDNGSIYYKEQDIIKLNENSMRKLRKEIQIIFQHSAEALDPKMTIEELLLEPLKIHKIVDKSEYYEEINRLLSLVGLSSKDMKKFPHQLSGGQRQRIGIARAIATKPGFIVCDEPVSALDVSVQGQILNLLKKLKDELDLTYLFISHDLKVIRYISDRIAVMYNGEIVEIGDKNEVLNNPKHEYTKKLIESMV